MPAPLTKPVLNESFSKFLDMSRPINEFNVPKVGMNALAELQRKNLQTMTVVSQAAFENLQSYIQRQLVFMAQGFQVSANLMNVIMAAPTAQEKIMRQAEGSKMAIDQYFSNARDASETLAKCNQQMMEIVSSRMAENLEELRSLGKTDLAA